jgi:hypothetical protein
LKIHIYLSKTKTGSAFCAFEVEKANTAAVGCGARYLRGLRDLLRSFWLSRLQMRKRGEINSFFQRASIANSIAIAIAIEAIAIAIAIAITSIAKAA